MYFLKEQFFSSLSLGSDHTLLQQWFLETSVEAWRIYGGKNFHYQKEARTSNFFFSYDKHWNSDVRESAAKIFSPLSTNIASFLSDQNILITWQTDFKDTTLAAWREAGLSNPGINYNPGQTQYFLSDGHSVIQEAHL